MKVLKLVLEKIVIVEVMLIILAWAMALFGISLPVVDTIVNGGLAKLTPVAIVAFVLYVIVSLISSKFVEVVLGIVLGGIILYYLFQ